MIPQSFDVFFFFVETKRLKHKYFKITFVSVWMIKFITGIDEGYGVDVLVHLHCL